MRASEVRAIFRANDAITYVFRLLGRQRTKAQRLPADALDAALKTLAEEKRHALVEIELSGGSLGRLLLQAGRPVSAHLGDADPQEALAGLRRSAGSARLQMLGLTDEQIALTCAALAGTPVALGHEVGASFDGAAFVSGLAQQHFTGVVALEQGLQTYIRRFQYGTALSTERLPDKLRVTRFTQIVWQEERLPEIGAPRSAAAPRQTRPPAPTPVADPPRPAQVQPPPHFPTDVARSLPETAPVQTAPAAALSAHPPVRVQAVQVQNSPDWAGPGQAGRAATTQPSAADADAWERLRAVLDQNMGRRSPRAYTLMRTELGAFSGAELLSRLAWQVERIAGATAAKDFRDGR